MKKKKRIQLTVEQILFKRSSHRKAVASQNLEDALHHTMKVLKKARKRKCGKCQR
jgi:hypothetical protein